MKLLHTREQVWSEFEAIESTCTQAWTREHWATKGCIALGIREA